jgi:hypothetical protein
MTEHVIVRTDSLNHWLFPTYHRLAAHDNASTARYFACTTTI